MNPVMRHEIVDKLYKNEAQFSKLNTNQDRIKYIFDEIMSWDQVKEAISSNMKEVKQRATKSLSQAKNYKTEADMFMRQVALGELKNRTENLNSALKSYVKVSC